MLVIYFFFELRKSFSLEIVWHFFYGRSDTPINILHHSGNSAALALLRGVEDLGLGGEGDHPLLLKRQHFSNFPEKFH